MAAIGATRSTIGKRRMQASRKKLPSQTVLLAMFRYDEKSGALWRKTRRVRGLKISISNTDYWTVRVIWKMVMGREPVDIVDARDGNPRNMRWSNLVELTHSEHRLLGRRAHSTSSSGVRGVRRTASGKYVATFRHNGKKHVVGTFATVRAAKDARLAAIRTRLRLP